MNSHLDDAQFESFKFSLGNSLFATFYIRHFQMFVFVGHLVPYGATWCNFVHHSRVVFEMQQAGWKFKFEFQKSKSFHFHKQQPYPPASLAINGLLGNSISH